ncbi:MAG: hypothetical protein ACRDUA_13325 [Micromonosporaceae bacterium]
MSQESAAAGKGISTPGEDDDTVTTTGRGPGAPDERTGEETTQDDGSVGTDGRGPG